MNNIVVGFDFSSGSANAVDITIDIANRWQSDIRLVYVKEKETNAIYITSNSTIITVNKGKSQTLSASLVGNEQKRQEYEKDSIYNSIGIKPGAEQRLGRG